MKMTNKEWARFQSNLGTTLVENPDGEMDLATIETSKLQDMFNDYAQRTMVAETVEEKDMLDNIFTTVESELNSRK